MSQESFKDEAARRNITAYKVKKERINDNLIRLKNRVKELEQQNAILKDENSELLRDNNDLKDENNLLKLEQFNTTIASPRLDDPFNHGSVALSTATHIYDASIPDILNNISPDGTEHSVLTHYDDSIPDILNNIQYSIPENFVRLAYS